MRDIRYKIHGAVGDDQRKYSSLSDLLFDIPAFSLSYRKIIPPFCVLNEVLAQGISDAGMSGGCKWQPFEISPEEYAELVEDLLTSRSVNLSVESDLHDSKDLN